MTDIVLRNRDIDSGIVSPDRFGAPLVGCSIAFANWASAANPTAEVLDQSTAQLVTVMSQGVTVDLTTGTVTIIRDGYYDIELILSKVSAASASGVMDFTVQKNSASLTPSITLGLLQPAVVNNHMAGSCKDCIALVKGDVLRNVVTGTTGGVITIAAGRFIVRQRSDATAFSQV